MFNITWCWIGLRAYSALDVRQWPPFRPSWKYYGQNERGKREDDIKLALVKHSRGRKIVNRGNSKENGR